MKTFELSEIPDVIINENISLNNIRLMGLRFGDSAEKIPDERITETNEYGWKICEGGARYRVVNGKIVAFRLCEDIISKLNIFHENQIELTFGEADKIEHSDFFGNFHIKKYHYFSKNLTIEWSESFGKLTGIIISRKRYQNNLKQA